jgi:hypothetical protein
LYPQKLMCLNFTNTQAQVSRIGYAPIAPGNSILRGFFARARSYRVV